MSVTFGGPKGALRDTEGLLKTNSIRRILPFMVLLPLPPSSTVQLKSFTDTLKQFPMCKELHAHWSPEDLHCVLRYVDHKLS